MSPSEPRAKFPRPTLSDLFTPLPGRAPVWLAMLEGVVGTVGTLLMAYALLNAHV